MKGADDGTPTHVVYDAETSYLYVADTGVPICNLVSYNHSLSRTFGDANGVVMMGRAPVAIALSKHATRAVHTQPMQGLRPPRACFLRSIRGHEPC